ncbi:MAG: dihydroorotate dehydrogenase electron transfer subunit, partial [Chromatiales bacterium]|nr:dihydroorotate dehydrogenase electron transfer subunit [Chromatiales bacterium]
CAVAVRTDDGVAMKRVCVDGPVFDAEAVFPPAA